MAFNNSSTCGRNNNRIRNNFLSFHITIYSINTFISQEKQQLQEKDLEALERWNERP